MEALRLYLRLIQVAIKARMQYRSDFFVGIISVVVLNWVNLSLIWIMISRFQDLQGWLFWEIVLLYAMWMFSHSIYALLFWHLSTLEDVIRQGTLDQYLIRPCSALLQYLGREVNYMGVADIAVGAAAFTLAYRNLGLDWSASQWLFFAVAALSGTIIETCISWIIGSISFWTGRSSSIFFVALRFHILTQQYPIDIFGKWYRMFVTGFLPVAFINYFPMTVLLGKTNALGVGWLGFASPAVALMMLSVATLIWQRGLAQYTSSGN